MAAALPLRALLAPLLAAAWAAAAEEGVGGRRALDDSVSLLSVDAARSAVLRGSPSAWDAVVAWVRANGGEGELDSMATNDTQHGGASFRGVVAREHIAKGTVLLRIPRKLWIWLENFPQVRDVSLDAEPACNGVSAHGHDVKIAAAMALESRKGKASFWATWLETLPTLADFRTFHPRLANQAVAAEFAMLPLMRQVLHGQAQDRKLQQCFDAWQRQPNSLVAGLGWDEVHGMLLNFNTRAYTVQTATGGTAVAMVPLSEYLNTGKRESLNTKWWPVRAKADFKLKLLANVRPGDELLDSYCSKCTNDGMLMEWGVYLEDNTNRPETSEGFCGDRGSERLQTAVDAVLDVSRARTSWTSPRCLPAALASEQGPLRCSLARLAWEQCMPKANAAPGTVAAPQGVPHASLLAGAPPGLARGQDAAL